MVPGRIVKEDTKWEISSNRSKTSTRRSTLPSNSTLLTLSHHRMKGARRSGLLSDSSGFCSFVPLPFLFIVYIIAVFVHRLSLFFFLSSFVHYLPVSCSIQLTAYTLFIAFISLDSLRTSSRKRHDVTGISIFKKSQRLGQEEQEYHTDINDGRDRSEKRARASEQ